MGSSAKDKTVIILVGPTAAGKTSLAIDLAKFYQAEIISADSRQCYKELSIGVARPSAAELNSVPHHFIASHSISDDVNAAFFEKYALDLTQRLFENHDVVVMVGGTGLYIKAFADGLDEIPSVETSIRERIIHSYETNGLAWLQDEVKVKDPKYYAEGEILNPQRMMRALEVVESSGISILSYMSKERKQRDFKIVKLGIHLTKEELHTRINSRVEQMMEAGLLAEVQDLQEFKQLNALQTVGYTELFDYLEGKTSLTEAIELIKTNTRRYAKRQMTWFRKDSSIHWVENADAEKLIEFAEEMK